ncbi:hypothetical protein M9H77_29563 [Catharanthus roseus]|uniref:Uncharacterized protein n=1 Tax=Catharanthus roseus TaxID=4058 RepID=A0ACB9ZV53_CATRO|nr:hypothetical protein M9H77_29563 [Catharanthus roseus]
MIFTALKAPFDAKGGLFMAFWPPNLFPMMMIGLGFTLNWIQFIFLAQDARRRASPTRPCIFSCSLLLVLCDFSSCLTAACLLLYDCELGLLEKERTESESLDLLLLVRFHSCSTVLVLGLPFYVERKKEINTPICSSRRRRNIFCNRLGSIFVSSSGSIIVRKVVIVNRDLGSSDPYNSSIRAEKASTFRKMKAILVQNKIASAICIPEKNPKSWKGEILAEKLGDAHSCLTLHLTNNVLREIDKKDNAFEIWTKLEKLYLGKSSSDFCIRFYRSLIFGENRTTNFRLLVRFSWLDFCCIVCFFCCFVRFLQLLVQFHSCSTVLVFGLPFYVGWKKEIGTPICSSRRRRNIFCKRLGSIFVSFFQFCNRSWGRKHAEFPLLKEMVNYYSGPGRVTAKKN